MVSVHRRCCELRPVWWVADALPDTGNPVLLLRAIDLGSGDTKGKHSLDLSFLSDPGSRLTAARPFRPAKGTIMTKQTALTAADITAVTSARAFQVQILLGKGKFNKTGAPTLAAARELAPVMEKEAGSNRRCIIHAIADGRAILVPPTFDPAKIVAVPTKAKVAKKTSTKPTAKPKAAKKPAGDSKAAVAYRMLTSPKGCTRAAIVEATNWQIDVRQFAERKGLKLRRGRVKHASSHGLRKLCLTRLAEAGCTVVEMQGISGHKDLRELQLYIDAANRKKAAAKGMEKLLAAQSASQNRNAAWLTGQVN